MIRVRWNGKEAIRHASGIWEPGEVRTVESDAVAKALVNESGGFVFAETPESETPQAVPEELITDSIVVVDDILDTPKKTPRGKKKGGK